MYFFSHNFFFSHHHFFVFYFLFIFLHTHKINTALMFFFSKLDIRPNDWLIRGTNPTVHLRESRLKLKFFYSLWTSPSKLTLGESNLKSWEKQTSITQINTTRLTLMLHRRESKSTILIPQ
jgi:hypothetical protein